MMDSSNKFLRIQAGGQDFALPQAAVSEVLPMAALERPAGLPRALEGFLNLGGVAVAVLSLVRLLDAEASAEPPGPYSHLIRLRAEDGRLALLADRVLDADLHAARHTEVDAEDSLNGVISRHLQAEDALIPLIDLDRLLTRHEQMRLAEMTDRAQARLAEFDDAGA